MSLSTLEAGWKLSAPRNGLRVCGEISFWLRLRCSVFIGGFVHTLGCGAGGNSEKPGLEAFRLQARMIETLEAVPDPDLHDPGFSRPDQDLGLAEVRTAQIAIDPVEVRMVRQVQRLEPELQVVALGDLDVLDERRVKVVEVRTGENVAADTAEAHPGSRRIHKQRVRRRDPVG